MRDDVVIALDEQRVALVLIQFLAQLIDERVELRVREAFDIRAAPAVRLLSDASGRPAIEVGLRVRVARRAAEELQVLLEARERVRVVRFAEEDARVDVLDLHLDAGLLEGLLHHLLFLLAHRIDGRADHHMHPHAILGADAVRTLLPARVIEQLVRLRHIEAAFGVLRDRLRRHARQDIAGRHGGLAVEVLGDALPVDQPGIRLAHLRVRLEGVRRLQRGLLAVDILVRVGEVDRHPLDAVAGRDIQRLARVGHLLEDFRRHLQVPGIVGVARDDRLRRRARVAAALVVDGVVVRGVRVAIVVVDNELDVVARDEGLHLVRPGADRVRVCGAVLRGGALRQLRLLQHDAGVVREGQPPEGGRLLEGDLHRRRVRRLDRGDVGVGGDVRRGAGGIADVLIGRLDIGGGEGRAVGPLDAVLQSPCHARPVGGEFAIRGGRDLLRQHRHIRRQRVRGGDGERLSGDARRLLILAVARRRLMDIEDGRRLPEEQMQRAAAAALGGGRAARVRAGAGSRCRARRRGRSSGDARTGGSRRGWGARARRCRRARGARTGRRCRGGGRFRGGRRRAGRGRAAPARREQRHEE